MTYEAVMFAIGRLIIARQNAHGNPLEQERINSKLTKLYDIRWLMSEQQAKQV